MNIYNISKGQLITLWFFGVILWFGDAGYASDSSSGFALFLVVLIPAALVFYTIGWRNLNKSKSFGSILKSLWGKIVGLHHWKKGIGAASALENDSLKRGILSEQHISTLNNDTSLKGIKGALWYFSRFFILVYVGLILQTLILLLETVKYLDTNYRLGVFFLSSYGLFLIVNIIFIVYTLRALDKFKPNAMTLLRLGLLCVPIILFVDGAYAHIINPQEFVNENLAKTAIAFIFFSPVFFIYLLVSKRVKFNFPIKERRLYRKDIALFLLIIIIPPIMYFVPLISTKYNIGIFKPINNTESSKWVEFYSKEGGFIINFPTYPEISKASQNREDLGTTLESINYQSSSDMFYGIRFATYPAEVQFEDSQTELKKALDGLAAQSGFEVISSNSLTWKGNGAIDYSIKNAAQNIYFKGRFILVNKTLYILTVAWKGDNYYDEEYNKFINSFELNNSGTQ